MKNKKCSSKSSISLNVPESNKSVFTGHTSKYSHHLITYYKEKSFKLEKQYNELLQTLDNIKGVCDYSNELQKKLNERNEEVSKLQKVVGDLQIHLFREREENLKLSAENDQLKIEDYKNKKKINMLLITTGASEKKFIQVISSNTQDKFVPSKLPPKLQKLKEMKQRELFEGKKENDNSKTNEDLDPQVLLLNNQLLASQLEHHIKISREHIDVLLKEKEISDEERKIEKERLQEEVESLANKLKECQELLCEATERLVKFQQLYEKEKNEWVEEKDKYIQILNMYKDKNADDSSDLIALFAAREKYKNRIFNEDNSKLIEKEELAAAYQEKVIALETEVYRLRERAQICRNTFKEKTEKMTAQVSYLKNKYEDLDRRRLLEAEGFRTDIRMLRERVKELEKKLAKASSNLQTTEQQQLLISARNTLNRAKVLEKELANMKSKISSLESNGDSFS